MSNAHGILKGDVEYTGEREEEEKKRRFHTSIVLTRSNCENFSEYTFTFFEIYIHTTYIIHLNNN